MKKLNKLILGGGVTVGVLFLIAFLCAFSWIVTCGIIYLITLCFGWTFSWAIATGVWLIMLIAKSVFSNHTTVKK